jgi:transposase InsO family protein
MYLLGAKHFELVTDHKPLLPMFNKPKAKLPPRIERMVMKMQNLDFTAVYTPGKTNMTDYLSRHPLPERVETGHENHVKAVIEVHHAIMLETIKTATREDPVLQQVKEALITGRWNKMSPELAPYYELRAEIYMAEGLLLRHDRIIPPETLREKIIRTAHNQGHLGITKTKAMIRNKYWFPAMNQRIENIVRDCFSCQISTNTHHTEPEKMTELPERPWDIVEMDFCGTFPNGEYALVMTDQYSRYPEVEFVRSTSNRPVQKKLKKIFSTYGVPKRVQTDNGPPFNSNEFQRFAEVTGFQHKKITPRHPKAQGKVEGFNKLVNKTASIASQEWLDLHEATYDMLQAYRSTPHPATKATPYELLINRQVRTKLDHFPVELSPKDKETREMDASYKKKVKQYHDTRHNSKRHKFQIGNAVVVKREKKRKTETIYKPYIYIITDIKGSTIFARRISDGKTIC